MDPHVSSDLEWRWTDPSGQQRLVREDELRAALASGVIPPNAPVWKDGWKDWQPAYAVPELTTSALAAANGVVPNIPPPPLGVLGAQRDMEKEGAALDLGAKKTEVRVEPPPPPRYIAAPTKAAPIPAAPASGRQIAPAAGSGKQVSAAPVPPEKPSEPSPDATMQAPSSGEKLVADESNTGVKLPVLTEATASQLLAEPMPPSRAPLTPPKDDAKALPTTVGVPALPESVLAAAAASALAPAASTETSPVPTSSLPPAPQRQPTHPPPLPPKASKPPPAPAAKKNKTLIMYGGAPVPTSGAAGEKQGPPINVPAPSGVESPQAITRPPPADGAVHVSGAPPALKKPGTAPPPKPIPMEELSQSMLVDDRDAEVDTDSIILSDSVRKVSSTLPPKPPGARSGTLLGFPVPTVPAPTDAPFVPPPPAIPDDIVAESAPLQSDIATSPPPASRRIVHDLRGVVDKPRPKFFWPVVGVGGAVVFLGLLGLIVGAARGKPNDDDGKKLTTVSSGSPNTSDSAHTDPTSTAPSASVEATPPPPPVPVAASGPQGGACALAGTSHTIAPRALVPTGVEVQPVGTGIGLGFATSPKDAMTVEVEPTTLAVGASARVHTADLLKRIVPELAASKLGVNGEADKKGDRILGRRVIPGPWPVDVGVADGSIVWAPHLKDNVSKLWPIDADAPVEALRGVPIEAKGEKGFAIAFRKAGAIWMGAALGDKTLTARGPLFRIMGLGPVVGSPTIASIGDSILIAWADRAAAQDSWGLRWVKFTPGEAPRDAVAFHPPAGGLGEHAMSPSLAAAGGGRYLFMWTEGPVSAHQVRAQTLSLEGAPLGDAFVVSADGVNAGQAQAAVLPDGRGVVAFLAAKGKAYEIVATPVTCAPAK